MMRRQHGLRRARRPRPRSCRRAPQPCSASSTNSTISTLAAGEDVGLHRGRHADGAGHGLRDLDLGRDHEVDVELPLAPGLQVLGALRAGDDPAAAQRAGLQRGDDVDLVAVRRGDDEVRAADAGAHQHGPRGAVALDREDVVAVAESVEAGRVEIDHGHVVLPRAATPPPPSRPAPRRSPGFARARRMAGRGRARHARAMLGRDPMPPSPTRHASYPPTPAPRRDPCGSPHDGAARRRARGRGPALDQHRGAGPREIAWLDEEFPFHELDLEDVQSRRQRPKVDDYPDYLFVVLHLPWYDKDSQRLFPAELNAFIGRDYLITLPNVPLKPVSNLFADAPGGRREAGGDVRQGLRPPLLRGARRPLRLLLPDPRAHRLEARRDRGRDLRGAHRDQRARHLERQAGDHRLPQDRQPAAPRAAAARPRHAPLPDTRTWRSTTTT